MDLQKNLLNTEIEFGRDPERIAERRADMKTQGEFLSRYRPELRAMKKRNPADFKPFVHRSSIEVDEDMRATINADIIPYMDRDAEAAQSGPMAYWIVANRIVVMSDTLAHNVVTGIMTMGLIHFKGESVPDCIGVLRNVLLFLGHGSIVVNLRPKCFA